MLISNSFERDIWAICNGTEPSKPSRCLHMQHIDHLCDAEIRSVIDGSLVMQRSLVWWMYHLCDVEINCVTDGSLVWCRDHLCDAEIICVTDGSLVWHTSRFAMFGNSCPTYIVYFYSYRAFLSIGDLLATNLMYRLNQWFSLITW